MRLPGDYSTAAVALANVFHWIQPSPHHMRLVSQLTAPAGQIPHLSTSQAASTHRLSIRRRETPHGAVDQGGAILV